MKLIHRTVLVSALIASIGNIAFGAETDLDLDLVSSVAAPVTGTCHVLPDFVDLKETWKRDVSDKSLDVWSPAEKKKLIGKIDGLSPDETDRMIGYMEKYPNLSKGRETNFLETMFRLREKGLSIEETIEAFNEFKATTTFDPSEGSSFNDFTKIIVMTGSIEAALDAIEQSECKTNLGPLRRSIANKAEWKRDVSDKSLGVWSPAEKKKLIEKIDGLSPDETDRMIGYMKKYPNLSRGRETNFLETIFRLREQGLSIEETIEAFNEFKATTTFDPSEGSSFNDFTKIIVMTGSIEAALDAIEQSECKTNLGPLRRSIAKRVASTTVSESAAGAPGGASAGGASGH